MAEDVLGENCQAAIANLVPSEVHGLNAELSANFTPQQSALRLEPSTPLLNFVIPDACGR
jgi:hypothetical protein